ncbi:hypothetical protein DXG01_006218 [Tephrocybe rancida]|nr:hypothetical protein DXG01_006218 [Tephrocybe rancida]
MSGLSSRMIAGWVNRTHQVPNADPHQPATPAFEIPTENLLSNYRPSSSAPFFAPQATTKQARRKRMPLEKEFGREQRNDYKYSHRQHTDALRAAAARPDVYRPQTAPREVEPERGRRMSRGPAPRPKSLGKHSLHHQMPGSDPYAFHYPHANHEHGRSASVQPSSRRFPGPMPEPWPNPGHEFGVPAYTQTNFAPLRARQQPTRSHTMPLLPPPASAPVNTSSQQYPYNAAQQPQYSRPHHSPNYSNSNPYASPSFSPPNSAPAFSGAYYQDQPVIPDPREFGNPKVHGLIFFWLILLIQSQWAAETIHSTHAPSIRRRGQGAPHSQPRPFAFASQRLPFTITLSDAATATRNTLSDTDSLDKDKVADEPSEEHADI